MQALPPINVAELFPQERAALLALLRTLSDEQWASPTVCADWSVHDVALHLLGGDIGILSARRDGYREPRPPHLNLSDWDTLVAFINQRNALWVETTRRISPRLLCEFLQLTGEGIAQLFAQLDQSALGVPVQWAGPDPAPVWLDTAREYTERWLHQQHIRDAVGQPGLKEPRWLAPVLTAFIYALPRALQAISAPEGTAVQLVITGPAGGNWSAVRTNQLWMLTTTHSETPAARVTIDEETAWRLFTRGISTEAALARIQQEGDELLASKVLEMVSIIA